MVHVVHVACIEQRGNGASVSHTVWSGIHQPFVFSSICILIVRGGHLHVAPVLGSAGSEVAIGPLDVQRSRHPRRLSLCIFNGERVVATAPMSWRQWGRSVRWVETSIMKLLFILK